MLLLLNENLLCNLLRNLLCNYCKLLLLQVDENNMKQQQELLLLCENLVHTYCKLLKVEENNIGISSHTDRWIHP